jgi:hypothetical protein
MQDRQQIASDFGMGHPAHRWRKVKRLGNRLLPPRYTIGHSHPSYLAGGCFWQFLHLRYLRDEPVFQGFAVPCDNEHHDLEESMNVQ